MKTYTPELKAQVIAEWQTQRTPKAALARKYDVDRGTVRTWLRALTPLTMVTVEKQHDIDALYTEFVAESLMGLRALARRAQDETWLASLKPGDAYLWFGTVADKVLAALQAYKAASERGNHVPGEAGDLP